MAEILDDIGEIGRMHIFEKLVRDVQANPALRIGLENVAEFPANRMRRDAALKSTNGSWRHDSPQDSAQDRADTDIDLEDVKHIVTVLGKAQERYIVDADDFAALGVDNLLIEQIAHHAQHVLVGVIRSELLVVEMNAVHVDAFDLVVTKA